MRKENRIKTIQSSSEIEGNTLTVEQITSIIENKRIIGSKEEILEVKNAIAVYDIMESFKRSIIFYGFGWDDMCEKCVGLSGIDFHIICGCLIRLTDDIHDRT